jgi:Skp family chaperone for outer membrane proteins
MKFPRSLLFFAGLALLGLPAFAQTAAPAKPAAKPVVKAVPAMKVAWINSAGFVDEQNGIKALVRTGKELELEFSNQQADLALLNEKLRTIVAELGKLQAGGTTNAEAIQKKQTEGLKLQQDLQARQQEFQAALNQAQQEKQGPIVAEIDKTMSAFAKEREIGILIDVAKAGNSVVVAQPELDVTADFVAYYNATHP